VLGALKVGTTVLPGAADVNGAVVVAGAEYAGTVVAPGVAWLAWIAVGNRVRWA